MKRWILLTILTTPVLLWVGCAATRAGYESPNYTASDKDGNFEIRTYPPLPVVSTTGNGMDNSFGRLFKFITGKNAAEQKIAMTTPVIMDGEGANTMSFVVPEKIAAAGTPEPTADNVTLRSLPGGTFAVLRFKGGRNSGAPEKSLAELKSMLAKKGFTATGQPRFAYYDPPWTPGPFRRNEVMLRISN